RRSPRTGAGGRRPVDRGRGERRARAGGYTRRGGAGNGDANLGVSSSPVLTEVPHRDSRAVQKWGAPPAQTSPPQPPSPPTVRAARPFVLQPLRPARSGERGEPEAHRKAGRHGSGTRSPLSPERAARRSRRCCTTSLRPVWGEGGWGVRSARKERPFLDSSSG